MGEGAFARWVAMADRESGDGNPLANRCVDRFVRSEDGFPSRGDQFMHSAGV